MKMIRDHVNATPKTHVCEYWDKASYPDTSLLNSEFLSTAQEFNELRYIFFADIVTELDLDNSTTLTVISPRNKTVHFLYSESPKEARILPSWPYDRLKWIWKFIENRIGSEFLPSEWRLRLTASPLEVPCSNDSAIFACTNAICIAFGYPLGLPIPQNLPLDHPYRLQVIQNRKERMAFNLHHGSFSSRGTPSDPFFYTVLDTNTYGTRTQDGLVEINRNLCDIDTKIFARTRKYEILNWKEMTAWCKAGKNIGKYEEYEWWRRHARNLEEFKGWIMERDYLIKTGGFVVGEGLVIHERPNNLVLSAKSRKMGFDVEEKGSRVAGRKAVERRGKAARMYADLGYRIRGLKEKEAVRLWYEKRKRSIVMRKETE